MVEVRPGEGGDDAVDFVDYLVTALKRWATRQGWQVHTTRGDSRTVTLRLGGTGVRLRAEAWQGTHRVQRVPSNDRAGRKHTSTATVAVVSAEKPAEVNLSTDDLRVDRMRGSGRGGQRRNKVETAVRITHLPTGIAVVRTSGRSQAANLDDAKREILDKLTAQAAQRAKNSVKTERDRGTNTERSGKSFTHCWYRDTVTDHSSGQTWTVRQWQQGRL